MNLGMDLYTFHSCKLGLMDTLNLVNIQVGSLVVYQYNSECTSTLELSLNLDIRRMVRMAKEYTDFLDLFVQV